MRSGKQKRVKYMFGNSEPSCSNGNISQSTCRVLMEITPLESSCRMLSPGSIYTKIRQVDWEIWTFEHDASEFPNMDLTRFSFPLLILCIWGVQKKKNAVIGISRRKKHSESVLRKEKKSSKMIFIEDHSKTLPKRHSAIKNIFLNCTGSFAVDQKLKKSEISCFGL